MYPKISIVTPNYNLGNYLEQTMLSVLDQNYPNLEYIIIDAGSTDHSLEIIKKHQNRLHYWVSEPDKGLYDALNKGFAKSSGEIMAYLNSDDLMHPGSLFKIAAYFTASPKIQWLQGYPTVFDEQGKEIFSRPPRYTFNFFLSKSYLSNFEFIQQESTFWHRNLWNKAGSHFNEKFKLAGDFDLWMRFFVHEKLYITKEKIGGFRKRENQLSANSDNYLKETIASVENIQPHLGALQKIFLLTYKAQKRLIPRLLRRLERFQLENTYLK